jgi:hypothetical protein
MEMDSVGSRYVSLLEHIVYVPLTEISNRFTGAYFISVVLLMKETRATIVLTRLASKKRKETGDARYQAKAEIEKPNLITLIKISCTRPICQQISPMICTDQLIFYFSDLLLTEPIVQSFSVGSVATF